MSNRYVCQGMVADALQGKHVTYVGLAVECRHVLEECAQMAAEAVSRVCRAYGKQQVLMKNGGCIDFVPGGGPGCRGRVSGLVYIDRPYDDDPRVFEDAVAMTGVTGGVVIRP